MNWVPRRKRDGLFRVFITIAGLGAGIVWIACGAAIDLGGSADGSVADVTTDPSRDVSALDASTPVDDGGAGGAPCDPCVSADDCSGSTVCARFASGADTYCGALCPGGGGCDAGETCRFVTVIGGSSAKVCAPSSGACPTAVSPQSDGSVLDHCGVLTGPTATADCHSCTFSCQTNGCFGGWWCNTTTRRCVRPPKGCP